MVEVSTTITTGRVSISPNMASVENTVQRGFVSVSVGGSVGGGITDNILLEDGTDFLLEDGTQLQLG